MASQAVERSPAKVPALAQTPALTITAEDIALPRIYIGQFMSKAVQEQLVKMGDIYAATGGDDPDPQILWNPEAKQAGVLFHVIGLRKGKSISDGGELVLFDYDDPSAPPDAWVTYNYTVCLPEVDEDVPYKLLLTRTGRPAALQINTIIRKNLTGPSWDNAYRLTTSERENKKGRFAVPRVASVEADEKHVALAASMAVAMSPQAVDLGSSGEEPSI